MLPKGVPSMGWRKFMGMVSGASLLSSRAMSILSLSVSPMPKIPPAQIPRPASLAAFMVFTRSA